MEPLQHLTGLGGYASYSIIAGTGLIAYLAICSFLRLQRINGTQEKYGFTSRESLRTMTNEQAQAIVKQLASLESPICYDLSLRIALFKTYAIEDIAKLLVESSDLSRQKHAAKRYEDTGLIFASFVKFAPDSDHLHKAVSRMNFLHTPYIKNGKISNRDLLYVLWASMAEPVKFMRLYEWRALTDMEVCAIAILWKYIGDMMQIDYKAELGETEWKDGIEFYERVTEWAHAYEDLAMKRLPEAKKLGEVLIDLLLSAYPAFVRPAAYTGVLVLLGDRMRHAFSLPDPSAFDNALVYSLMFIRKSFVRYLLPPRFLKVDYVSDPNPKTGRLHNLHYLKEPWYTPVSIWSRWSPEALFTRITGGQIPGDGGAEMLPEGFLFTDLGPRAKMGKGIADTEEWEQVVKTTITASACPFGMK